MYYNAEVKEMYLSSVLKERGTKYERGLARVFNFFAPCEENANVDLGRLSRDAVVAHLNTMETYNYLTAYDYALAANNYRTWFATEINANYQTERPIDVQSDIDFVRPCRQKLYQNIEEILSELRSIDYDFFRGDEAAPAICLAWLGLKVPSILNLKNECVNLQKGFITDELGNIMISDIPEQILEVFVNYKSVKTSYRILNGRQSVRQLDTGYFIHKMVRSNSQRGGSVSARQLYARLDEARRACEEKHGPNSCKFVPLENVWTSGCFHRLYQLEKAGLDIYDKANFPMLQKVLQGGENRMYGARYVYTQYKKAFNLE